MSSWRHHGRMQHEQATTRAQPCRGASEAGRRAEEQVPPVSPPAGPLLVSEPEAARLLGISPRTLFGLAADPTSGLRATHIGSRKLYSVAALAAWVESKNPGDTPKGDRP